MRTVGNDFSCLSTLNDNNLNNNDVNDNDVQSNQSVRESAVTARIVDSAVDELRNSSDKLDRQQVNSKKNISFMLVKFALCSRING